MAHTQGPNIIQTRRVVYKAFSVQESYIFHVYLLDAVIRGYDFHIMHPVGLGTRPRKVVLTLPHGRCGTLWFHCKTTRQWGTSPSVNFFHTDHCDQFYVLQHNAKHSLPFDKYSYGIMTMIGDRRDSFSPERSSLDKRCESQAYLLCVIQSLLIQSRWQYKCRIAEDKYLDVLINFFISVLVRSSYKNHVEKLKSLFYQGKYPPYQALRGSMTS